MYQYHLAQRGATARCAISTHSDAGLQDFRSVICRTVARKLQLGSPCVKWFVQQCLPISTRHALFSQLLLVWQVVIEKQKLHVGVKGQPPILDGEMYAAVKPDDSFWNSDGTALEITLQKVRPELRPPSFGCGIYLPGHAGPAVRVVRAMHILLALLAYA